MKPSRLAEIATGMKVCKRCGETKALDDFDLITNRSPRDHSRTWTYPRPECSACSSALKADRWLRNQGAYRETKRRHYVETLEKQAWWRSIQRAKSKGATQFLSLSEWEALRSIANCHWCGMELHASFRHIDHVTPLSSGGQHSADNLVASCANCNMRRAWESSTKYRPTTIKQEN